MSIFTRIFKNLSLALLIGIFSVFCISITGFVFGQSINQYYSIFGLIISVISIFIFNKRSGLPYKYSILQSAFLLCLIFFLIQCAVSIYDTSWDGRDYHQAAILFLKDGWNPFYIAVSDFVKNNYDYTVFNESLLWVQSYVKFEEIFAASVFSTIGKIEAGKIINYLSVLVLLFYSVYIIEKPVFSDLTKRVKFLILSVLVLNPVFLVQMSTYYNDGLIYCYLMMLILTIFNIEYNNKILMSDIMVIFISGVILSNIKMGGLLYLVFFIGVYLIYLAIKKFKDRLTKLLILSLLIVFTVVVTGINPYFTNVKQMHNPFYPLIGADKSSFLSTNMPQQFVNKTMPYKLFYSVFSKSENLKPFYKRECTLKLPLTVNFIGEMPHFEEPDVRVGGFGPFWSGILLLSLFLFLSFQTKEFYLKQISSFIILLILLSVLVNPENWWARYVPQFWFFPLSVVIYSMLFKKGFKQSIAKFVLYLMIFNSLLIFYVNERYVLKFSENLNKFLHGTNKNIMVYFLNKEIYEISFLQKLNENSFKYTIVDSNYFLNNRQDFKILPYPYTLKTEFFICNKDGEK